MAAITIFNASFCRGEEIAAELAQRLRCRMMADRELIDKAHEIYGISRTQFERTLYCRTSIFNQFTHERERYIGYFKSIIADLLINDDIIFHGFSGHLVPKNITHVLKVCLIADTKYRVSIAKSRHGLSEEEALNRIRRDDKERREWTEYLLHKGPFNPSLYDIVLPMDKKSVDEAITLISDHAQRPALQPTETSIQAVKDYVLAANVGVALAQAGHSVDISVKNGKVTLTINKHVLILSRLEEELTKIAKTVSGVTEVETQVGPDFYQPEIYRKFDSETPSKILLVDDEREFVQTLSERLLMRDMGSAVAYDGLQALSVIEDDEPEVMILDLKMPGIDGMEVLRRVKSEHPQVEVIVLTGHGTTEDQKTCIKLGAFAYLQKPVDIEVLTKTMKAAYDNLR